MLLVDGRGNDELALDVADDAARKHVRPRERIEIVDGVEAVVVEAEHRDLPAVDERTYAGVRDDVGEAADRCPHDAYLHAAPVSSSASRSSCRAGRIWPRSGTNTTFESGSSLFTKCRKRFR